MADSVLRDKAKQFAKNIVFLCREIKSAHKEAVLVNQLLRSATSIGANLHEAQYAQSKNDFKSKLEIAQKECYETEYWLELLFEITCTSLSVHRLTSTEPRDYREVSVIQKARQRDFSAALMFLFYFQFNAQLPTLISSN